ncbi:hypothetical protein PAPHI01_0062 [Pancytospora philotis]|nr:hypothetical protein PAPHI01_0062 [Pancytospora philotis]
MLRWLIFQMPVFCASTGAPPQPSAPVYTGADYAWFGNAELIPFSDLEKEVLTPLCQDCLKHDNPEIPKPVADTQLNRIAAEEKAHMVLYSVPSGHASDPLRLPRQAETIDYGARKLLCKLFDERFVDNEFTAEPAQGCAELHRVLVRLLFKYQRTIKDIRSILETKMPRWDTNELTQFIEHNRATTKNNLDLMIMFFSAKMHFEITLATFFKRLVRLWPGDADRLDRLIPIACDFVRTAHYSPTDFGGGEVYALDDAIVEYVIREKQAVCFELFKAILDDATVTRLVNKYINDAKANNRVIDQEFLMLYARYIRKQNNCYDEPLQCFCETILPPTPDFHEMPMPFLWNREPAYFNSISCRILRKIFTEMHEDPNYKDREERTRKYMNMLDYDVFYDIMKGVSKDNREPLAKFMAFHMNEERRAVFRKSLSQHWRRGPHAFIVKDLLCTMAWALNPV